MAAVGAVAQFNEGASGKKLVMEKAGITWDKHAESGSAQKKKKRIDSAKRKSSQLQKKARKKIRLAKLRAEEEKKSWLSWGHATGELEWVNIVELSCTVCCFFNWLFLLLFQFWAANFVLFSVGFNGERCKLREFIQFLWSDHVTYQIWSWLSKVKAISYRRNMAKNKTQDTKGFQDMMVRSHP